MKRINQYVIEKLKLSKSNLKNTTECTLFPTTKKELVGMIKEEINQNGNECSLNHIEVNKITDMKELFSVSFSLSKFNGDISEWDVSNVTDMSYMFCDSHFNGDITNWDVSNVKDMYSMFEDSKYNGDIANWNVLSVKSMANMFKNCPLEKNKPKWFKWILP